MTDKITWTNEKRKLRDLIEFKENNFIWEEVGKGLAPDEFKILESRQIERKAVKEQLEEDFNGFKKTYWDARLFGNTFLE